jgi:hypothetical protein
MLQCASYGRRINDTLKINLLQRVISRKLNNKVRDECVDEL